MVRKFGARRHYCFSSRRYRLEAARITEAMVRRYGANPFVHAWQTDNEYGDHDTIHSYSDEALYAFREWLAARYGTIEEMNRAWGTSFWSMHYNGFDEVDLPNNLVEEPSPTHLVDYFRFSSDQVKKLQQGAGRSNKTAFAGPPGHAQFHVAERGFRSLQGRRGYRYRLLGCLPMGGLINGRLSAEEKARYLRVAIRTRRPSTTTSTAPSAAGASG